MVTAWWITLAAVILSIVIANGDDDSVAPFVIMFVLIGILIGISMCLAITT